MLDAVLLLVITFTMLFTTGMLCPPIPLQCEFPAGISCYEVKLWANTGKLSLNIRQGTGKTIVVTGVSCTQNVSQSYASSSYISYDAIGGSATTNVTIPSGSFAFIADPTSATDGINNVTCTDANGNLPSDTKIIGAPYTGRIYVRYTEMDTNLTKTTTGTFTVRYEA
ncbi:hypothetical protein H0N99_04955 [Candidatus Micrarchaeota archaeon]|nr:hypothetical protein [Candidatus Micrarchaeota archaeon]